VSLLVGVPAEVKPDENRVAVTPDGVREAVGHGVRVLVEAGAGRGSSITDDEYLAAGADVVPTAVEVWARADLVCKVKEPQPAELSHLRPGQVLLTYLHLAAYPDVGAALLDAGVTGVAYETVQLANGALPLLAPMSEVAGRMAVQVGAACLERHRGGRGVLLGGVSGVNPARVVVLGGGNVGWNAAWLAAGLEADVRGPGLMVGVEFVRDRHPDPGVAKAVQRGCLDERMLILTCSTYGNVLRWIPPLIASRDEIDQALQRFDRALERAAAQVA